MPSPEFTVRPGPTPGRRWLAAAALLGLSACAALKPPLASPGQTEAQALAVMGEPTGRYTLDPGRQRLEFAKGPYGRETYMVDLAPDGRVTAVQQVLTPQNFEAVRNGMSRDDLLRLLGRPGDRAGEFMNRETWSWRYPTYDCLWVRVTLTPEGRVLGGASYLPDPICDADQ